MIYRKLLFLTIIILLFSNTVLFGDIAVYTLQYSLETETVEIKSAIPVLDGLQNEIAQKDINQYLRDSVINFTDDIKRQGEQSLKELIKEGHTSFKYQAYVLYELKNKEKVLSLLVSYYQFTGGAHGLTRIVAYNLDPVTGEVLTFQDILELYRLKLADIKHSITNELKKEPLLYFFDAEEYIENKDEFNFYVEDNYMIIYFQQYEIAPYVAGIPEFKIPF